VEQYMSNKSFISEVIESVVTRLQEHPEIIIDELTINPPATKEQINAEQQVPGILKEFYTNSDGLILAWHVKDDPVIRGGIIIPLLENIHNSRWKPFGILDHTDDVHAIFQKKNTEDSRVMMESLEGDEDIEFTELRNGVITIEEYFQAFNESLGFRFWQENYHPLIEYSIDSIIANRGYLWGSGETTTVPELHSAHVPN